MKDGKVIVLYRAEDDSGEMAIGGHTSRLGMATSDDGIHFRRMPEPVFWLMLLFISSECTESLPVFALMLPDMLFCACV